MPTGKPCILIYHDESTFRSGDVSPKRWMINESTPFFNKGRGRGRSRMVPDFLVSHPFSSLFFLCLRLSLKKQRTNIQIFQTSLIRSMLVIHLRLESMSAKMPALTTRLFSNSSKECFRCFHSKLLSRIMKSRLP